MRDPVFRNRRPDWSVAPEPSPPDGMATVSWIRIEDAHDCRSNLSLPMAPWLLARAVRRMWRRTARWWR